MAHRLDYENYDHLCRLRRALRAGKHAPLKPLFPDIVRMNIRRFHEPGLIWAEEEPYEHYDDFLRRCWHIHHLVGDLWAKYRPTIPEEDRSEAERRARILELQEKLLKTTAVVDSEMD